MKKLLLTLFILPFLIKAQAPYNKLLGDTITDWYMFNAMFGVEMAQKPTSISNVNVTWGKYTAKIDTIILAKKYKKFYHIYTYSSFILNNLEGYIREDSLNRKVYFIDKSTMNENLLYDFSLNVGDTVFLNFPASVADFPKGFYKVSSIQNVNTQVGARKQFNLKNYTNFNNDSLTYIESIGCIIHPAYLYSSSYWYGMFNNFSTCPFRYALGLACKYSDATKYFQSCTYNNAQSIGCFFKQDSCNYWNNCGGINELTIVKNLIVSPNPTSSKCKLTIELEKSLIAQIDLYDVTGRKVKQISSEKLFSGVNEIYFETAELQNGLYYLKSKGDGFELNYPLVISH